MCNAKRRSLIACLLMCCLSVSAAACSHFFDNNVFPLDDREILSVKTGDFYLELVRLGFAPEKSGPTADSVEIDCEELREALRDSELSGEEQLALLDTYRTLRITMREVREKIETPSRLIRDWWPAGVERAVPEGLPPQFGYYLAGALAYDEGDFDAARACWRRVLALAPEQRRQRTVWAAYMMGRSYVGGDVEGDGDASIRWMRRTRELATAGFADRLDLARAARGWEAQALLRSGAFEASIALYFQIGDELSLADAAQAALHAGPGVLNRLARDRLARGVLTACVVARGGPWRPQITEPILDQWLGALEKAGITDMDLADRVAWAAYEHGRVDSARRWLERARGDSHWALWLRSKFLMRDGQLEAAAEILVKLVDAWPVNDEWNGHWEAPVYPADHLVGELSMLTLQRGRYVEAMDLLLRAGFLDEAAHIAERVLSVEELRDYVDRNWSQSTPHVPSRKRALHSARGITADSLRESIRYLLARRLTRLQRYADARSYFPASWQSKLDQMVQALEESRDVTLSRDDRGEALWRAARIARYDGMELMGTHLGPDFYASGGNYGNWPYPERLPPRAQADRENSLTGPHEAERVRILASRIAPEKRFHYRYVAADWAWQAAVMLPDESDLKARVLCEAGQWLANREPEQADKFYKALVNDCGTTRLGRKARSLRWFPSL